MAVAISTTAAAAKIVRIAKSVPLAVAVVTAASPVTIASPVMLTKRVKAVAGVTMNVMSAAVTGVRMTSVSRRRRVVAAIAG